MKELPGVVELPLPVAVESVAVVVVLVDAPDEVAPVVIPACIML